MSTDLALRPNGQGELAVASQSGLERAISTAETLQAFAAFIKDEMREGIDFMTLPGTDKKCLVQPGAQKTALFFNAYPKYVVKENHIDPVKGHIEYRITCRLLHRQTREVIGEGCGSCSTMEGRYRFRKGQIKCPHCGAATIFRSKDKPGWFCWKMKGGCGANFAPKVPEIVSQNPDQVENENVWDVRNTVLKMACKRGFVAACITIGCLSEMFTQDLEDVEGIDELRARGHRQTPSEPAAETTEPDPGRQEVNETFPSRAAKDHGNESGYGKTGAYASPEATTAYLSWVGRECASMNAAWTEFVKQRQLDVPNKLHELIRTHQLKGHLLKWAKGLGLVNAPENAVTTQTDKFGALVWERERARVKAETVDYYANCWFAALEELGLDENGEPIDPDLPDNPEHAAREAETVAQTSAPKAPAQEPAPAAAANWDKPPRSGKALFAWTMEQEQRYEVSLLKYLNNWAKLQQFPDRMVEWDADQVALGFAEGCRKLHAVQHAAQEDRETQHGDAYEGDIA